jgi:AraC-like DNA-binding protein
VLPSMCMSLTVRSRAARLNALPARIFVRYAHPIDVLADMLTRAGVRGALGARIDAGADWGWWAAPSPTAAFHAVTSGVAYVALPGEDAPRQLAAGDVLLLPRGGEHVLGSDPAAVARTSATVHDEPEWAGTGVIRMGTGPARTHILCAHYEHDPAVATPVLALLPDVVHLRADHAAGGALDDTVRLLARELADPQLATAVVLNSLVDILLVQLLRAWLDRTPEADVPSWLGALRDPVAAAAMSAIHGQPGRAWTTEALATEIAVSRATLARRFAATVGETPGAYLTRWRMDLAARALRDTDESLESIAQQVGYTSVYAFNRAFRRARALPPGRYRTTARASAALAS